METMALSTKILSRRFQHRLLEHKNSILRNCYHVRSTPLLDLSTTSRGMSTSSTSTSSPPPLEFVKAAYKVVRRGPGQTSKDNSDGTGSREYLLLPPDKTLEDLDNDTSIAAAALLAHRNMYVREDLNFHFSFLLDELERLHHELIYRTKLPFM